jgi:hypothetical protein
MASICRPSYALVLAIGMALTGCKNTKIVTYRVAKSPAESIPTVAATPGAAAIHWVTPDGWHEEPASGLRQGSFSITGPDGSKADMSVITFPGNVGGDLANINRWRNQVQLPPISPAELPQAFTKVAGPAGEFLVADLLGTDPNVSEGQKTRILGAILSQPTQTWFFKLTGGDALVESQKPAFIAFLKSVRFPGAPAVASGTPAGAANTNDLPPGARGVPSNGALAADVLPPGHPPVGGAMASGGDMNTAQVPVASGETLVWTAPPGWTPTNVSPMRKGSYSVSGPDGTGDISITAFPGDVGGNLANVNRWRGQLGLAPVDNLTGAVETLDVNNQHMLVFDGSNAGQAILGAILPQPGQTWFFKLTGPATLVARTKPAFLNFLRTVKVQTP